jgi:peptide/nickel transport system permease protein
MSAAVAVGKLGLAPAIRLRIGLAAALAFLLFGFASVVWTPYPVGSIDVAGVLQDPGPAHWLGTDQLGHDLFSALMKGVLTSFAVAAAGTVIAGGLGLPLGMAAARPGSIAQRLVASVERMLGLLPMLVVAIVVAGAMGPGIPAAILAIGIAGVVPFAAVARDGLLALGSRDYVAAARLAGMRGVDLARRHLWPALTGVIAAQVLAQLAAGVLGEATLAFVGIGTQAPASSPGLMLREALAAGAAPAPVLVPGLAIVLIALALGVASSSLRELAATRPGAEGDEHGAA